jgi:hypothetical protein
VLGGEAPAGVASVSHPTATAGRPARRQACGWLGLTALGAVLGAIVIGLLLWAPWQQQRQSAADFLAGTWCQPMSGDASATWRFTALGQDRVNGEITYTHATDRQRFDTTAAWTDEGLNLTFTAPPELVGGEPIRFTRDGDNRLSIVVSAPDPNSIPPEPLTRCPG